MKTAVYWCRNRRCRAYHVEVRAMPTQEHRAATGSAVACADCGDVLVFRRFEARQEGAGVVADDSTGATLRVTW